MDGTQFCAEPINGPDAKFIRVAGVGQGAVDVTQVTRDELRRDDALIDAVYQKWGGTSGPRVLGAFLFCAPVGRSLVLPGIFVVRSDELL